MPLIKLINRTWYAFVRCCCYVAFKLAFRLHVLGEPNVPRHGAVLLLSSHASHLDPVLIGVGSRRQLRFLARDSLFFWPLGALIRSLGAIPIHREGSGIGGLKLTLRVLKQQEALLLFPEGSRSYDGSLQPLKPGFCALARRSAATIVPVGIAGADDALPRGRILPRFRRICLQFDRPVSAAEIADLSEDELVKLIHQRIGQSQQQASVHLGKRSRDA